MSDWNPRFVVFARTEGLSPEQMVERPGMGAQFIVWVHRQWREFRAERCQKAGGWTKQADHDAFDAWLQARHPHHPAQAKEAA